MKYVLIILYLLIGTVIATAMSTDDKIRLVPILFWPLLLIFMAIIGIFGLAILLGEKIRNLLW